MLWVDGAKHVADGKEMLPLLVRATEHDEEVGTKTDANNNCVPLFSPQSPPPTAVVSDAGPKRQLDQGQSSSVPSLPTPPSGTIETLPFTTQLTTLSTTAGSSLETTAVVVTKSFASTLAQTVQPDPTSVSTPASPQEASFATTNEASIQDPATSTRSSVTNEPTTSALPSLTAVTISTIPNTSQRAPTQAYETGVATIVQSPGSTRLSSASDTSLGFTARGSSTTQLSVSQPPSTISPDRTTSFSTIDTSSSSTTRTSREAPVATGDNSVSSSLSSTRTPAQEALSDRDESQISTSSIGQGEATQSSVVDPASTLSRDSTTSFSTTSTSPSPPPRTLGESPVATSGYPTNSSLRSTPISLRETSSGQNDSQVSAVPTTTVTTPQTTTTFNTPSSTSASPPPSPTTRVIEPTDTSLSSDTRSTTTLLNSGSTTIAPPAISSADNLSTVRSTVESIRSSIQSSDSLASSPPSLATTDRQGTFISLSTNSISSTSAIDTPQTRSSTMSTNETITTLPKSTSASHQITHSGSGGDTSLPSSSTISHTSSPPTSILPSSDSRTPSTTTDQVTQPSTSTSLPALSDPPINSSTVSNPVSSTSTSAALPLSPIGVSTSVDTSIFTSSSIFNSFPPPTTETHSGPSTVSGAPSSNSPISGGWSSSQPSETENTTSGLSTSVPLSVSSMFPGTSIIAESSLSSQASTSSSLNSSVSSGSFAGSSSTSSTPITSSTVTPPTWSTSIVGLQISSSTTTSFPYTITTTKVFTSRLLGGAQTTYTTFMETGVLSTDAPRGSHFSHNTRAIIGVSFGITAALILGVVFIFFGCRRYKRKHTATIGSTDNFLDPFADPVWRPPLVDDDTDHEPSYGVRYSSVSPYAARVGPSSLGHSGEGDAGDASSSGVHGSSSGYTHIPGSSVESAGAPLVRNASYCGNLQMSGFRQTMDMAGFGASASIPTHQRRFSVAPEPGIWLSGKDVTSIYDGPSTVQGSSSNGHGWAGQSTTSLAHGSSSHDHGGPLSSSGHGATMLTEVSGNSESTPTSPGVSRAPTSISHKPSFSYPLPQQYVKRGSSRADRNSVVIPGTGIPDVTIHVPTAHPSLEDMSPSRVSYPTLYIGPSSLLNPMPPQLHPVNQQTTHLWPLATFPAFSTPTDDSSSLVEGLLNPHLGMEYNEAHQASMTSLRDNVDYTRPINPRMQRSATSITHSSSFSDARDEDTETEK